MTLIATVGKIFEAEFQVFVILLWEKGGEAARVGSGVTDGGSWERTVFLE